MAVLAVVAGGWVVAVLVVVVVVALAVEEDSEMAALLEEVHSVAAVLAATGNTMYKPSLPVSSNPFYHP